MKFRGHTHSVHDALLKICSPVCSVVLNHRRVPCIILILNYKIYVINKGRKTSLLLDTLGTNDYTWP